MFDRSSLSLPVICAPMFLVTGPDLVREACLAGLVGVIPRHNARTLEQFEGWLEAIQTARKEALARSVKVGPLVVNVGAKLSAADITDTLQLAASYGVETVISVGGGPREVVRVAHSKSMVVLHDVISLEFAKKASGQGVDGLIAIGLGGGGHSGLLSHLTLIEKIRTTFKGPLVMAGGISTGAGVRAAEVLGADYAYMGTRFIATKEANAPAEYKQMLVESTSEDLVYTPDITGVAANWLKPSLQRCGIDIETLAKPGAGRFDHLPNDIRPWRDIWSAGQGIDLIDDVPSVATLVARLVREYQAACSPGVGGEEISSN
ncbi:MULTISPECIES: NAD(P)H-dependent flavin oxidoreductase [Paraburkholderia]|uniref:Nitronate monooxygenase n=1 Tax=Paraburkholderia podalyriae TaxID=1938811 RepID=A0ABR7Q084_9BURK|nr:nitronate monooxygenase [Paraburkholderia podalyriae]MBC8751928.1 nitronate monooxygenase [Paraburkholderia podalyriae]